jgi:hypothetical protein
MPGRLEFLDGTGKYNCRGHGNVPGEELKRPVKRQGHNSTNPAKQDSGKGHPDGSAPEEGVCEMDPFLHFFMYQNGASKASMCQLAKRFSSFILFCKITNKNS